MVFEDRPYSTLPSIDCSFRDTVLRLAVCRRILDLEGLLICQPLHGRSVELVIPTHPRALEPTSGAPRDILGDNLVQVSSGAQVEHLAVPRAVVSGDGHQRVALARLCGDRTLDIPMGPYTTCDSSGSSFFRERSLDSLGQLTHSTLAFLELGIPFKVGGEAFHLHDGESLLVPVATPTMKETVGALTVSTRLLAPPMLGVQADDEGLARHLDRDTLLATLQLQIASTLTFRLELDRVPLVDCFHYRKERGRKRLHSKRFFKGYVEAGAPGGGHGAWDKRAGGGFERRARARSGH